MNSADFLMPTLITLDIRISLGHALGYFLHSLPAFYDFFPYVHDCKVETPFLCKDYRLHIEPFRHFVTEDVLLAATKVGFSPTSPMRCQAHLFCTRPGNVFTVV
jgi:hypothetical protein